MDSTVERAQTETRHRARDRDEIRRRELGLTQKRLVAPDLGGSSFAKNSSRLARLAPQDNDAIRRAGNEIEIVTRDQDRVSLFPKSLDRLRDGIPARGVQPGGRLIE